MPAGGVTLENYKLCATGRSPAAFNSFRRPGYGAAELLVISD